MAKFKREYTKLKKTISKEVTIIKRHLLGDLVLIGLAILSVVSFYTLRNIIMLELGVLGFTADLFYELIGTKNGWWKYDVPTVWKIANRVPIEVPLTYFFMGVVAAAFVFFRLS